MTATYTDIEICVDCVMLIANGETPEYMSEDETAEYLAAIEVSVPNSQYEVTYNCPEDCEGSFSYSWCDMCRRSLGGDRHPAALWEREGA